MPTVICDWLDVTFPPDDHPLDSLTSFLNSLDFSVSPMSNDVSTVWLTPSGGLLRIDESTRWVRVSASGSVTSYLRDVGAFDNYLALLSLGPYRITRLDCALDFAVDASPVVLGLQSRFPRNCPLLRKAVGTSWVNSSRSDGAVTGTFYAGKRRTGSVTARVYDKQHQMLEVYGVTTGPLVRYEITVKRSLAVTLRDASLPAPLFYHVASPSLLPADNSVPAWHAGDPDSLGWSFVMPEQLPYARLKRRVDTSPEVGELLRLTHELGPEGLTALLRMITTRYDSQAPAPIPEVSQVS